MEGIAYSAQFYSLSRELFGSIKGRNSRPGFRLESLHIYGAWNAHLAVVVPSARCGWMIT
jgi:hypothetical protein